MEIPLGPGSSIASAVCLLAATVAIRIAAPSTVLWARQADKSAAPTPRQVEFFEANIRPVLIDTCGECHTDNEDGELRTDSRAALLKGGETGPAIVPGDPEQSLLIHVIRRDEGFPRMPKSKSKLPAATVAAFVEWIKEGAPWPADNPAGKEER
jgi:hypothetical protein